MSVNFLSPTRNPRKTFKKLYEQAKNDNDVVIGDAVITKRLQARGIDVFPSPVNVLDGFCGKLGRIYYAGAINGNDNVAMNALREEKARRSIEMQIRYGYIPQLGAPSVPYSIQSYHDLLLEDSERMFTVAPAIAPAIR